jgi:SAM-dependent methyltransferase
VLDLGCGSGRVGLHLARYGHRVRGLDLDADLVAAFNERARGAGLAAEAEVGDAREFDLEERFAFAMAPMQVVQLLGGADERRACLRAVARHLESGARFAAAIVEAVPAPHADAEPPLPDARELDGWVYSSLPLAATPFDEEIVVRRLRQAVSPSGELSEETDEVRLRALSADRLEAEATEVGLRPAGRREVPATDAHVGSTVVLLERGA